MNSRYDMWIVRALLPATVLFFLFGWFLWYEFVHGLPSKSAFFIEYDTHMHWWNGIGVVLATSSALIVNLRKTANNFYCNLLSALAIYEVLFVSFLNGILSNYVLLVGFSLLCALLLTIRLVYYAWRTYRTHSRGAD